MQNVRGLASLWVGLALLATLLVTFGTISALFGLNHGIIDQAQYSYVVATVIGSAVIPTMIANARFMPRHLLLKTRRATDEIPEALVVNSEG
jgi:hypothetical protein